MSAHTIPDLLQLWTRGEVTVEQAIGHMLQNLLALSQRLSELEQADALRARQLKEPATKQQL